MPGTLLNGQKVELFRDGALFSFKYNEEVIWDPPDDWRASFRSHRWFKFFENGFNQNWENNWLRLSFGRFLCRGFNSRYQAGEQLYTYEIWVNIQTAHVDTDTKTLGNKWLLWSHKCFDERPRIFEPFADGYQV